MPRTTAIPTRAPSFLPGESIGEDSEWYAQRHAVVFPGSFAEQQHAQQDDARLGGEASCAADRSAFGTRRHECREKPQADENGGLDGARPSEATLWKLVGICSRCSIHSVSEGLSVNSRGRPGPAATD